MRLTILFSLLFGCFGPLSAKISERLLQKIEQTPNGSFHTVRIEFADNVDCFALNHAFKQARITLHDRARTVVSSLQHQAENSQFRVKQLVQDQLKHHVKHVHTFWVVNLIILQANEEAIQTLAKLPEIALIDLEDADIVWHDPIIQGEAVAARSPNGIEPGLVAINAPAMWDLGYSGRGRLVYDYDTGVWPTHPAFADRFLAHRFPMSQCWTGYFNGAPNGSISDHGTHTLGTIAGLIEASNDTIGVAYKAYWIANDFVTSTVEELPPLAAMMGAFEWALNPDGDSNTTTDIPDVINNSWRWRDDPDTVQCAGPVVSLMNAIEAAGIANVFSGGNSGPGNTTVNAPQRINTSEVNTFCVGSVDGNQNFPYPISNFSTRGPSQCPHNGSISLSIHPEVVAPGQNVRSAWGTDSFNTISGTSMAAPHVSGAILLLKEAFPYLSGEELLWALYLTAVDLGDAGEDNIYGRGMIDVYAAFQLLEQDNTPVDPNDVPWDLSITSATDPVENGFSCDDAFSTTVSIKNLGNNTITTVHFQYDINGFGTQNFTWNGTLLPGNSTQVDLPSITTTQLGPLDLNILASIDGQPNEYDLYNNRWRSAFDRRDLRTLPFTEEFEYGFELNNWLVQNPDGATTWSTFNTAGLQWNATSATVQCYGYSPRANQKDGMISSNLEIPTTVDPVWLLFDLAYQKRTSNSIGHDSLHVHISSDCGESFTQLYAKAGDELNTSDTIEHDFVPLFAWDWRTDSIPLNQFAGQSVLLRFQTTNRWGNNIYIDNIKVFSGTTAPASVGDRHPQQLQLFPNPSSGNVFVRLPFAADGSTTCSIHNALGQEMGMAMQFGTDGISISTASLPVGLYLVTVQHKQRSFSERFIKN